MLEAGNFAPKAPLTDLSGHSRSLQDFWESGPTLVALFKVSCPTCQYTLPFLERLKGGQLQVVGISQDDAESTGEFNAEFGLTFPVLVDSASSGYPMSNDFGISHVPSLFVVQPDGLISWSLTGFSRQGMEELSRMAGVPILRPTEHVPDWKSG